MSEAFGTSTPTSTTVVATSTSISPALKRAITSPRSRGGSRPWANPTVNCGKAACNAAATLSAACDGAVAGGAFPPSSIAVHTQ